jgi:hypothetical protein
MKFHLFIDRVNCSQPKDFTPWQRKAKTMNKIIGFTLLIIVIGTVLGLGLSGLNPWISPAEARQMDVETQYKAQKYNLELQETQNRITAENKQADQNLLQDQQIHEQTMINNQRLADTGRIMLIAFSSAVSVSIIILSIRMISSTKGAKIPVRQTRVPETVTIASESTKKVHIIHPRETYDPWNNPGYQRSIIRQAGDNEREKQDDETLNARLQSLSRHKQPTPRVRIISGKQYYRLPQAN